MRQKILYVVIDCGDGSATVRFYEASDENLAKLQELVAEDYETYGLNEGEVHSFEVYGEHNIRFSTF